MLPLCNALRAADVEAQFVNSYAQMDSLYRTVYDPLISPGKGKGWKPFGRMEWFYGQRAFPSGDIPVAARMQAWQEKQAARGHRTLDENWTAIGPNNIAGRILSIAWHPTDLNIIYIGSASGGLWKTTNGGTSWVSLTDDLPSLAVGSVALDPTNPNVVYIGTGEGAYNIDAVYGAGILKSTDGGATWNTTGMSWTQSQSRAINKIVIHPSTPQTMWCATNIWSGGGGVYRTTDGGASWTRYLSGDAKDLVLHPDSANVLYAAIGYPWGGSSNGVYKSSDGGLTWTLRSSGLPGGTSMGRMALSISRSNPQTVYAGISRTISGDASLLGIYRTTDAGASWSLRASTPNMYGGQGWYDIVCEVHPTNPDVVFSAGLDLYKSTNGGTSWSQKTYWNYSPGHSLYAHADHHALAFKPGDPNTVIAGTDGGMYKSTNGGDTWTGINSGLSTLQFYGMCNDYLNGNVAMGGTQDNGTVKYSGSSTWSWILGGDGGYTLVDYTNSNIIYASTQRGGHYKSTNGGSSFFSIQSGISGSGAWVTPTVMDPTNPSVLYTGTTMVYKTTNGGTSWTAISSALSGQCISTIAVAPSNPQVIYVGYENNGQVRKTTNGGTSWSSCYSGLPYLYITRVAVHPSNPNTVFVTVSGYGTGHVWRSTDGGTSWSNASTGVPDMPCNAVVIDGNDANKMYLATDLGVYASTNGGSSWTDYSNGLPNAVVDDIALHPTTGMLRASTHGRGMWQTSTGTPSVTVLTPNGGESWITGSSQAITWGTGGLGGRVSIELNRSYPAGGWESLTALTANGGSWSWTVTTPTTSTARVRITSVETPSATDVSNGDFSITQPQLTVTAPNGGETWPVATSQTISWTLSGASGNVVVQLDRNYPSGSWETLATTSAASYAWTATTPASGNARVRAYLQSNPSVADTSNASFTIAEPSVTVTYPNGGEALTPGSLTVIRWTKQYLSGSVKVEINRTYPSGTWVTLAASVSVDTLLWTVDQNGTTTARIRVTSNSYPSATDVSNADFTVLTPSLAVTLPNGGEVWNAGTAGTIRWSRTNLSGAMNVYVNRDYPGGSWAVLAVSVTADTFVWNVVTPYSNTARMRVSSVTLSGFSDESNADFVIGTGIMIAAPNGAESWALGSAQSISWTRYNAAGAATVQVNRNYPGGAWETLSSSVTTNSLAWTVSGPGTTAARVRVFLNASPGVGDTSDGSFSIPAPNLTLTAPNGAEQWAVGSSQTMSWTRTDATGNVTVQLNRSYPGASWETLTTTAAGNSLAWTVTAPVTSTARVRIYLTASPTVADTSAANFTIIALGITITSPNGGEQWSIGSAVNIAWVRVNADGAVTVALNRSYPGGAWQTLSASETGNSMIWTVSGTTSSTARVRITLNSNASVTDESNANFTIVQPALTLSAPNGGETYTLGGPLTVRWSRTAAPGAVTVMLNRTYPNNNWETLTGGVTADSFAWTASGSASSACRVKIRLNSDTTISDLSAANFSLVLRTLTLTTHNGGETLYTGSTSTVSFTRSNATGNVTIQLNRNFPPGGWETLSTTVATSSYNWSVSGAPSSSARLRVFLTSQTDVGDTSNANFAIAAPALTLTSPNGGEQWIVGTPHSISWTRAGVSENVRLELKRNYPSGSWETIASSVAGSAYTWTISGATGTTARVRVVSTITSSLADTSNASFSIISSPLTLSSPNGGEIANIGFPLTVRWLRVNAPGETPVELNRSWPSGPWELLGSTTADSLVWNVTGPVSTGARIKISLAATPSIGDTSAANFTIQQPALALTSPVGGERWATGNNYSIIWTRTGVSGGVRIELNADYPGGSWVALATGQTGNSYSWTISQQPTETARIRVLYEAQPQLADTSGDFAIVEPGITLIRPNGGDTLVVGQPYTLRWQRSAVSGAVKLELNRSYPSGTWETLNSGTTADTLVWAVAGTDAVHARVRVSLVATPSIFDVSDDDFMIAHQGIVLLSPVAGDSVTLGMPVDIRWANIGVPPAVNVYLKRNWPSGSWEMLVSNVTTGSFTWTAAGNASETARFRVLSASLPSIGDTTDGAVRIGAPQFTFTTPASADTFYAGESTWVRWTRHFAVGAVRVELSRDGTDGPWAELGIAEGDSIFWAVSGPATTTARLRVSLVSASWAASIMPFNCVVHVPSLSMSAPLSGATQAIGRDMVISWTRSQCPWPVDVLLQRSEDAPEELVRGGVAADSVHWIASGPEVSAARVIVRTTSGVPLEAQSATFALAWPQITLIAPQGGEMLLANRTDTIRWQRSLVNDPVRVELNRGYPSGSWTVLFPAVSDTFVLWNVTGPNTTHARVRILSTVDGSLGDTCASDFEIWVPELVLGDLGRSRVLIGFPLDVTWSRTAVSGPVSLYMSRDSGSTWPETIAAGLDGDSYEWIPAGPAGQARLKIQSVDDPQVSDVSEVFALAQPLLAMSTPAGGETFALGSGLVIRWTRTDHPATVNVQLNRLYPGGAWQTIAADLDGDTLAWLVSGPESEAVRVRVVSQVDSTWRSESGTFALRAAALHVALPLAQQEIIVGDPFDVGWQRIAHTRPVRVLLHTSNGTTEILGSNISGNSLTGVTATLEADSAWILVEDEALLVPRDSVLVSGPIVPRVAIAAPETGMRWIAGRSYVLRVNRHHAEGELSVTMNLNHPGGAWLTLGSMTEDTLVVTAPGTETGALALAVSLLSRPSVADTVVGLQVVRPAVTFEAPSQAAVRIGDVLNVTWSKHALDADVRLELDRHYPSGVWELLYEGDDSEYPWTVTGDTTSHARLRLLCSLYPEAGDTLDHDLVFYRPELRFETAFDAEYNVGDTVEARWIADWVDGPFRLLLVREAGLPETIAEHWTETGFEWTATPPRSDAVMLIVQDENSGLADTSRAFAVRDPQIRFTQPSESGTDTVGSVLELAWEWTDAGGAVRLDMVRNSLSGEWQILADSVSESRFSYIVTAPGTDSLWFRVSSLSDSTLHALSVPRRVVEPALALQVEGGTWYVGEQRWIYWTRSHCDGPVTVELTGGDRAEPWQELAAAVTVDSFLWTVSGPEADLVALRVSASTRPWVFDTTDAPLRIALPRLEVVAPNGGESLEVGEPIRLRWTSEGFAGGVGIGLWRGDPVNRFDTLFTDTPNDSSEIWEVSGLAAHDCYLIVVSLANPALFDTSDAHFGITDGSSASEDVPGLPREYSLGAPYPNPFNSTTNIEFALPRDGQVSLVIFDVLGREVERLVDEPRRAGLHRASWRADRAASGMYFVRLGSGDYQAVRKLHLIK
ncbi:MAG: T9SS type A sorting domain-containing protein [bacterium]|nr:T9SS type A sorting domain-containing protein [bacterium]